jgi:hypothetical protein
VIEASDEAHSFVQQRSRDTGQIVRSHEGIAVRHDQHVVVGMLEHIDQTADLAVVAVLLRVYHDFDGERGKLRDQARDDRQGRVTGIPNAENDLELRIILTAEGAQVLVQAGLGTA